MLNSKESFKAGFLMKCAEAGLTMEETEIVIDKLLEKACMSEKNSGLGMDAYNVASKAVGGLVPIAAIASALGLVGVPAATGALAGSGLAGLSTLGDEDPDEIKNKELIDEYKRVADRLQINREARLAQSSGRVGRPLI